MKIILLQHQIIRVCKSEIVSNDGEKKFDFVLKC